MHFWAGLCFVAAVAAAVIGYSGIFTGAVAVIAQVFFFVFLVCYIVSVCAAGVRPPR